MHCGRLTRQRRGPPSRCHAPLKAAPRRVDTDSADPRGMSRMERCRCTSSSDPAGREAVTDQVCLTASPVIRFTSTSSRHLPRSRYRRDLGEALLRCAWRHLSIPYPQVLPNCNRFATEVCATVDQWCGKGPGRTLQPQCPGTKAGCSGGWAPTRTRRAASFRCLGSPGTSGPSPGGSAQGRATREPGGVPGCAGADRVGRVQAVVGVGGGGSGRKP